MKDDADAGSGGQAKRARKTERVKERKNTHDAVFGVQHENLVELFHVRSNIVVREDDTFGVAGRAAGKNNRGDVIERRIAITTCKFSDGLCRQEADSQGGGDTLAEASGLGDVLDENRLPGRLDLDFFKKDPRGDNRFQVA